MRHRGTDTQPSREPPASSWKTTLSQQPCIRRTYQANLIASCMYLGSSTLVMIPTFGFEMFAAGVPKFVLLNTDGVERACPRGSQRGYRLDNRGPPAELAPSPAASRRRRTAACHRAASQDLASSIRTVLKSRVTFIRPGGGAPCRLTVSADVPPASLTNPKLPLRRRPV